MGISDALLYLGYLLGFVIVPGCLAFVALSPSPGGRLRVLSFGWALGYVLAVIAFMLTAALGARGAYWAYPVVIVGTSVAMIGRRGAQASEREAPSDSTSIAWGAAIVVVVMVCFALAYFPENLLPGTAGASYFPDYVWHVALSADALHHWPIQDPHAAGAPQPYHYLVNLQIAATGQVTGLDVPLILFRLSPLPMVALFVLQIASAGRSLLGSIRVGLIAAGLMLLVADLQMDPTAAPFGHIPFLGLAFTLLFASPSFVVGMILFTPLVVLIGERVAASDRGSLGGWILIALFCTGAALGKVTVLPLLLLALIVFGAWSRFEGGMLSRAAGGAIAVIVAVTVVFYLLLYGGHSGDLSFDPFVTFAQMPAVLGMKGYLLGALPDFPLRSTIVGAGGVLVGFVGLTAAQLVGLIWLVRRRGFTLTPQRAWLFSLLIPGIGALFLVGAPATTNQLYFVFLGMVAGCLLSAEGLQLAWQARPRLTRAQLARSALISTSWVVALIILIAAPAHVFDGPDAPGRSLLFWYGGLAISLALLYAAARRWLRPDRWLPAALCSAAIVLVGALAVPFSYLVPEVRGSRAQIVPSLRLRPELESAMKWVRDDVPFSATIAANASSALQFNYSAFSEHRVFIEGWQYSQTSVDAGFEDVVEGRVSPFADRLAINRAAFGDADPDALSTMYEDYGVRYLVIDDADGFPANVGALRREYEMVYEAPGVLILKLDDPA